jgi:predicted nucleotidyltransferase
MSSHLQKYKDLVHPPKWLPQNVHYEVIGGSVSYGVSNDTSDMDVIGFCMPPKTSVFPHLSGEIPGFGRQIQRFEVWQEHHVKTPDNKKEYDFTFYSIVKFFQLCMENNPNMLDYLFTPQRCVLYCSPVAQMVRDNRKMFLHKGSYHKFRGYAYQQKSKIINHANSSNPKRKESIEKYGYDVKFAYHVLRLALEGEQILLEGDLDIERNSEILKSVRRGEWTLEKVLSWFDEKEKYLEEIYAKSDLRNVPDEDSIKTLLLNCLEHHYGSLTEMVKVETNTDKLLNELKTLVEKYT